LNQTIIAIIIFLIYWALVNMLKNRGILEKYNISAHGPLLMVRTTQGQKLLDFLAKPKKFWRLFANIGIPLMFIGMIIMSLIIMLNFVMPFIVGTPEPGQLHEPQNLLLIPGVNEFIPFTWGLIALIITLIVHEFSHAILAKVENVKVKSMGVLLALIPVGGFAELDEEALFGISKSDELKQKKESIGTIEDRIINTDKNVGGGIKDKIKSISVNAKARILAAGVMSNFVVTLLAFLLLFGPVLSGIAPVDNAVIISVDENSNSYEAGLRQNMVIIQINDNAVRSISDIESHMEGVQPGTNIEIYASYDGDVSNHNVKTVEALSTKDVAGVYVQSVVPNTPAENAGMEAGMHIIKIDGVSVQSPEEFMVIMQETMPHQVIDVDVLTYEMEVKQFNIQLADRNGRGFLGVSTRGGGQHIESLGLTLIEFPADAYLNMLNDIPSNLNSIRGWLLLFALPIIGIAEGGFPGFNDMLMQFYEPVGWAESLGVGIFWIANILLWTGWLNFSVGLFNCIPAIPLDGGHVFKGYFEYSIKKLTKNDLMSQNIAGIVSGLLSIFVLLSFAFMIFGPFIVHGF